MCTKGKDCVIECDLETGCLLSEMDVYTNKSVTISCSKLWSCFSAEIIQNSSLSTYTTYGIICDGEGSCREMDIAVSDFRSFTIYCIASESCNELSLTLEISNKNSSTDDGIIHCISINACDDLNINTNSEFTKIIMYQYSENVIINNEYGYIPNIKTFYVIMAWYSSVKHQRWALFFWWINV